MPGWLLKPSPKSSAAGRAPSAPKASVYVNGEKHETLQGPDIVREFTEFLDEYVATQYGPRVSQI